VTPNAILISIVQRLSLSVVLGVITSILLGSVAFAQYHSSNYKSNEVFFGSGGDTGQSSASYKAQVSVGALGVSTSSSSNYQAYNGFLTPNVPFLALTISTSTVNLGTLSTGTTATGNATFQVTAYVDSGYTVQSVSPPPNYTSGSGSHTLTGMSLGGSTIGTEQFGMNLEPNTSPTTFGLAPAPQPNGTFANGQAATGYSTANQYKYNAGDVIACSGASAPCSTGSGWGETIFTLSYVANISPTTPAGFYTVNQDLVVVATY
jgi:hypothetical protein